MSEETAEIFVTIGEDRIRLVLPGEGWLYPEAKLAKQVSEGMTPTEIEAGLLEQDPDAWLALLRVSYMRAGKELTSRDIANLNLGELMEKFYSAISEVLKALPPTSPSANGSTALAADSESEPSEAPSLETTI